MSDSLYIVICLIGVFISAVLLVREKAFRSKDICINAYINLLISTCVFCLNDALWGCANQGYFNFNWIHVVIFSYIFHFCASLFSLNWFRYTVLYIYSQKNKKLKIKLTVLYSFTSLYCLLFIVSNNKE